MPSGLKDIFDRIFPAGLYSNLRRELKDCRTVLDVGCGKNSLIRFFSRKIYAEGVDIYEPYIKESERKKIHHRYHLQDLSNLDFAKNSFDCVMALDVVEHFEKAAALGLIGKLEAIAKKRVIIFTTNGFVPQHSLDGNPWQVHRSGFSPAEMRQRGYRVIGINGHKDLRTQEANLKYRPRIFWLPVSLLSQFFVRSHPEAAFQILCVKDMGHG